MRALSARARARLAPLIMVGSVACFGKASQRADLLDSAVHFYGAQRCGDTHNWLLVDNQSGSVCHMQDGQALPAARDLSGGWHDAGDYLKFTRTIAWSAYELLKAFDTWPQAFEDRDSPDGSAQANGIPDVLDEVRVATDYLLRTHPSPAVLVAFVGSAAEHDTWTTSPYASGQQGPRPVAVDARADIAGTVAAALGLMARVYAEYDEDYAAECEAAAKSVYAYAKAHRGTTASDSAFYADQGDADALLCGATELYRLTGDTGLLFEAIDWDTAAGTHGYVVGWAHQQDLCRHSLFVAGHEATRALWERDVQRYPVAVTDGGTVNGLAWFDDWGSLRHAANAGVSAALYYEATGEQRYKDFALSQLAYITGDNDYGRSFVVGVGDDPPTHPHHRNAYGREALDWDLRGPPRFVLEGALVGGPTKDGHDSWGAGYSDEVTNYIGNEVTIDYNASLVALTAFGVAAEQSRSHPEASR